MSKVVRPLEDLIKTFFTRPFSLDIVRDIFSHKTLEVNEANKIFDVIKKLNKSSDQVYGYYFSYLAKQGDEAIQQEIHKTEIEGNIQTNEKWKTFLMNANAERTNSTKAMEIISSSLSSSSLSSSSFSPQSFSACITKFGTSVMELEKLENLWIEVKERATESQQNKEREREDREERIESPGEGEIIQKDKKLGGEERQKIEGETIVLNNFVVAYSKIGEERKALKYVQEISEKRKKLFQVSFTSLVSMYAKRGDMANLHFWISNMASAGLKPDKIFLNTVIGGLSNVGNWEGVNYWLSVMTQQNLIIPDSFTFSAIMGPLAKYKDISGINFWYDWMKNAGMKMEVDNLNIMIGGLVNDVESANNFISFMEKEEVKPDVGTYNSIIFQLSLSGKEEGVLYFFKEMKKAGFKPNSNTFLNLIQTKPADLELWLEEMKREGVETKEDVFVVAFKYLARAGNLKKVQELLEAGNINKELRETLNNTILKELIHLGDVEKCKEWILFVGKDNLQLSSVFNFVQMLVDNKEWKKCEEWMEMMMQIGTMPSAGKMRCLIHGHVFHGDVESAKNWIEKMESSGLNPGIEEYNSVIPGMTKKGDLEDVKSWIDKIIRKEGMKPNAATFDPLIGALAYKRDTEGLQHWCQIMEREGIKPPLREIVNVFVQQRDIEGVRHWLGVMEKTEGIADKVNSIFALVYDLTNKGELKKAQEWLNLMVEKGVKITAVPFNALLSKLSKQGDMEAIDKCVEDMKKAKVKADVVTYNTLIGSKMYKKDDKGAMKIVDEMKKEGVKADVVTFNLILDGLIRKKDVAKAKEWYKKMSEEGLKPNDRTKVFVVDAKGVKHFFKIEKPKR